jgi:hypothetical protein
MPIKQSELTFLPITGGNATGNVGAPTFTEGGVLLSVKYEPKNANIQSHISNVTNPHSVTKQQVGLGNVQDVDTTNASNITSGVLDDARIPSNITRDGEVNSSTTIALSEKVDITTYTSSDVLTKIKTVDGSGSGLDADLLDGKDSSYFQVALGYYPENPANKNALNGYAGLTNGKIDANQLPSVAITDTFVVASQVDMLALTAQTGDVAIRTDISKSFILQGVDPANIGNWQELRTPVDVVQSVAGKTGVVTLVKADVGLSNVDNTTDLSKPVSTATQTALNLKANLASPTFTGTPTAPTPLSSDNGTTLATTAFVKAQGFTAPTGQGMLSRDSGGTTTGRTITAGSGVSVVYGDGTLGNPVIHNTDMGSSQNIFKIISVPSNADVVADSNSDTLTLTAGNGMVISTNSATDTITFALTRTSTYGSSSFLGNSAEVTIAHGLGVTPLNVNITPTSNPGGYLGEIWCRKDATNIYVGNTGTALSTFDWSATK